MAASIYATPPPDLSSEDTALSDVSNASSLNNRSNNSNSNSNQNTNNNNSNNTDDIATAATTHNKNNINENNKNVSHEATTAATVPASAVPTTTTTTTATTVSTKQKRAITEVLAQCERSKEAGLEETLQLPIESHKSSSLDESMLTGSSNKTIVDTATVTPKLEDHGSDTNDTATDANAFASIVANVDNDFNVSSTQNASAATIAAVAAAANAAMQLQLLEAINDAAKKRRKQNNPSRLGAMAALNLSGTNDSDLMGSALAAAAAAATAAAAAATAEAHNDASVARKSGGGKATALSIDYEEKLSKMFLPKSMEQLKETFELLQQQRQQQIGNISPEPAQTLNSADKAATSCPTIPKQELQIEPEQEPQIDADAQREAQNELDPSTQGSHESIAEEFKNPYLTFCKKCGENFETEFKLGLHMLQEHRNDNIDLDESNLDNEAQQKAELIPFDMLSTVNVKMERPEYESTSSPPNIAGSNQCDNTNMNMLPNGKEPWMNAMPSMGFPFPAEAAAAAALSASGYLPLLGVPGFPTVDGLNRPPLRIFNPEAYCDLCNKEFCNKYFLKTHKANKHGIYDPAVSSSGDSSSSSSNTGSVNTMTQMLQLQMQQQQQQQQQQHMQQLQQKQQQQLALEESQHKQSPIPAPGGTGLAITPPAPPPVYCEICSKRFTNVFAMRRHRAKAHEQPRNSPNEQQLPQQQQAQPIKPEMSSAAQSDAKNELPNHNISMEVDANQFQMPEGFRQDFTLEQEEVSFTPQPRKLSPQSQQQAREANFAHDKLRRLGVLNPEAFCEICCKEYCNKYFLRTHKWKRHGIFVPPDDLKEEQLQLAQKMPWPFMTMPGMPLNLMMVNEKAIVAQRMLAAATTTTNTNTTVNINAIGNSPPEESPQHLSKRIKLEQTEEEPAKTNDENQENKCMTSRESLDQQSHLPSMPATPEPQKILAESFNSGANLPTSPETAIGLQNLQKLQSMLQQLNDLNGKRPAACHICGREMEHQYALHAHMMTEHVGVMDSSSALPLTFQQHLYQQQQQLQQQTHQPPKLSPTVSPGSTQALSELRCHQCDRDFGTLQEFKQHIADVHLLSGSPLREGFATPERPINPNPSGGSRPPYTITPTSSYCEICNKELCNKYFMKTHMQRMHGIEIENGAQIGGVVCNICNKELCSKYFLRVHKHNTHGIVEEGAPLPQPRQNGLNYEAQAQQQQQQQQQQQPQLPQQSSQQQVAATEHESSRGMNLSPFGGNTNAASASGDSKPVLNDSRYYNNYTEICAICTRRFRSAKWLRAHLLSDHGPAGIEKLRDLEQQYGPLSKSSSPTLKVANGTGGTASSSSNTNTTVGNQNSPASMLPNPANLAQALQNLNAQHLLGNMPKNMLPGMFSAVTEQSMQSPRLQEYQCSMCPFTTPYYAFLFIHERSHSILSGANESATPTPEQLINSVKDEFTRTDDAKLHKNDGVTTGGLPDKLQQQPLPLMQPNTVADNNSRNEPTNLTTRTTTPTSARNRAAKENQAQRAAKQAESKENQHHTSASSKTPASVKVEKMRTVATSPIYPISNALPQDMLHELANKSGKSACYAIPKDNGAGSNAGAAGGEQQMQAFIIEAQALNADAQNDGSNDSSGVAGSSGEENSNRFVPAIVYLPVRKRILGPITVSFNLTPA